MDNPTTSQDGSKSMVHPHSPPKVRRIIEKSTTSPRRDSLQESSFENLLDVRIERTESNVSDFSGSESQRFPVDESYTPKALKVEKEGFIHEIVRRDLKTLPTENFFEPSQELEGRVMVLYTGGTVGMKNQNGVYVPVANYLPQALKKIPHLHDSEYAEKFYKDAKFPPLVLPPVRNETRRIVYWVFEYEPLLDSSDMTFDDWIRIASDIKDAYEHYDGFVVLHGTDTLCYTASALSFMFENLGKTIIFTGAQIPVAEVRSDGRENFIGALIIAANYDIPEICIYFNNKLMRANRCSKFDNSSLDAFRSPNMGFLAEMEVDIKVNWDDVFRSPEPAKIRLQKTLNRNVGILRIFPSITLQCVKFFLQAPIQGVVLQTFGAGNIPSHRKDILEELKKAVERGVIIVNCSQCARGQVSGLYFTGKILYEAGVIPGSDMTPEAALTKLAYVLAKDDWSIEKKRRVMQRNIRGELTVMRHGQHTGSINLADLDIVRALAKYMHVSSAKELQLVKSALLPPLVCSAAANGDLDLIEQLHSIDANLALTDYDSRSPLHVAASAGHLAVVNFLLKHGVSVHLRDRWDDTPLLCAVKSRRLECVKALLDAGAHLTLSRVTLGTELCISASIGDVDRIKCWRLAGADLNAGDYENRTALHLAVAKNHREMIKFLLSEGSDPNAVDNFGRTPATEAKAQKQKKDEIFQLLGVEN